MEPIRPEGSLTDRVTRQVRQAILDGEFEPGTLYAVHAVASQLGVSRTPVREALIRLSTQGLVQFERNRGFVVLSSSSRDLRDIFCLRVMLEVPAARSATLAASTADVAMLEADIGLMRAAAADKDAERLLTADRLFHRRLLTIGGNGRLVEFVDGLRDTIRTRDMSTPNRSRTPEEVLAPHEDLLTSVRAADADGAARTMRDHLVSTARSLLAQEFGAEAVADFEDAVARLTG